MTEAGRIQRIELAVVAGSEPIRGSLRCDGTERTFTGWLQLAGALEQARTAGAPAPTNGNQQTGGTP